LGQRLLKLLSPESPQQEYGDGEGSDDTARFARQMADLGRRQRPGEGSEDRRRDRRTPVDTPASMRILNPLSGARIDIHVLDVSDHGLKLSVPHFLSPGTGIQVRLKNTIAMAEVRYCRPMGAEFHVGVWIQDVFPWKPMAR
jgi:hypothetical protein